MVSTLQTWLRISVDKQTSSYSGLKLSQPAVYCQVSKWGPLMLTKECITEVHPPSHVHHYLLPLVRVEGEVVVLTPWHQVGHLDPVGHVVPTSDESGRRGVVELHDEVCCWRQHGCSWTGCRWWAEDTSLWGANVGRGCWLKSSLHSWYTWAREWSAGQVWTVWGKREYRQQLRWHPRWTFWMLTCGGGLGFLNNGEYHSLKTPHNDILLRAVILKWC